MIGLITGCLDFQFLDLSLWTWNANPSTSRQAIINRTL